MSLNSNNYFPKNYHSSGLGVVNLAALGYSDSERSQGNQKDPSAPTLYPALPVLDHGNLPKGSYPHELKKTTSGQQHFSYPATGVPYPGATAPYPTSTSSPYPSINTFSYPHGGTPYPSANAPYPHSGGNSNLPYPTSNTPYPSGPMGGSNTPYPSGPMGGSMPSLPYPTAFSGMPIPYQPGNLSTSSSSSGVSSLYPSLPSLPDGVDTTFNIKPIPTAYPSLPTEDKEALPPRSEEPSVGVPEMPFNAIKVPLAENMFWLGEKASGLRSRGDVQDYFALRNQCHSTGALYEDEMFPASNESLQISRRPDRHVEWLRPHEISDNPQFFVEGYSRFDVQQGELGDCWLLAATANLTQDPNLFFRVVPAEQTFDENYFGIFHFCFWQYGKWIDVVIDDRLPTYRGELLYMHSTEKNEFWSALLEKAYAKLHGSYEALKGGTTCEAMEDFTGGVTEWYDMKEAPANLFSILQKAAERNSMMGCSLEPDPNVLEAETREGLIRGHAYSITKVSLIDIETPNRRGQIPMIRLRNPWGNEAEWNGAWSDQSPEWRFIPESTKMEIGLNFDQDGEFWMAFQDFLNNFDRVEICNLSPDSLTEEQRHDGRRKWEMSVFEGEWTQGVTAGGCRNFLDTFWHNPQYIITLEDPDDDDEDGKCTAIIALMQKNRRSKRNMGMECLTIGFAIYHLTERDLQVRPQPVNFFKYRASVARSPHFINTREVCARFKLPPGHYLIVPSTFDPNEEGEFLIRVFSEHKNNMEENDEHVGYGNMDDKASEYSGVDDPGHDSGYVTPGGIPVAPTPHMGDPQRQALERLFRDIAGSDMEVDWMELKRILDHSMRDDLPKTTSTGDIAYRTQAGLVNGPPLGNGDDGGGGGGGGGNLLALLCGPFCKGNREFEQMIGINNQENQAGQNQVTAPISSSVLYDQGGFSKDVCRSMVAMMDTDQSGKLGFEEFQTLLTDIAKWKAVFKLYDRKGEGRIEAFELRTALNSAGYRLNNRILNALAHRYGSRDGKIAFDDFIMCAVKIKTYIDIFKERDTEGNNMATFSMDEWIEKTIYS